MSNNLSVASPRRLSTGELAWGSLIHYRTLQIPKNLCYAGAYVYGRTKMTKTLPDRKAKQRCLTQDWWQTLILDQHPGYITWAEYEANIAKLKANAAVFELEFTVSIIAKIRTAYGLESRFNRLRNKGMLTLDEMAQALGVHPSTVNKHARRGWLVSVAYSGKQWLYAPLPPVEPTIPCARCQKPTPERTRGQRRRYCSATCRTSEYAAGRRASGWVRPQR